MKVLIVDDSSIVRARLAALLGEVEGVEVVAQAEDAMQAFDMVREYKPDVAIVDVRMPRRSGIDLIEDVKRSRQAPKIIVITNYPTAEARAQCLNRGADYFFDKSGDIDRVVSVLKTLERDSRCH